METEQIPAWLAEFEPGTDLVSLVEKVNNIYHASDAKRYDSEHPEIYQQLPSIWKAMSTQLPARSDWRVLDFGCGTGFEASQILRDIGPRIIHLIAYDPSPEMIDQCKRNLNGASTVRFTTSSDDALATGPFNLLLTNSVLHHLPDIMSTIRQLTSAMEPEAIWLAGHEPSRRYYLNEHCQAFFQEYSKYRRFAKYIDPSSYVSKLRAKTGTDALNVTAVKAVEDGLFGKRPTPKVIERLVDFHVPHSVEEVSAGRGLDFTQIETDLAGLWKLKWVRTYSFLGSFKPSTAPKRWQRRAQELEKQYPNDGANFCMVLERI